MSETKSRLYSFINDDLGFNLHVFDGNDLINELTNIHNIGPIALPYYKNTVLSSVHMLTFLKPGESLGIYIDSDEPYFRYKIEMHSSGQLRTLLLPEEFSEFPDSVTGQARVSKIYSGKQPYTSIVELRNNPTQEIINNILKDSYQTKSKVFVSKDHNQAVMLTKLPRKEIKKVIEDESTLLSMNEFELRSKTLLEKLLNAKEHHIETLVKEVESQGFTYLSSKQVEFHCPCSYERMSTNLHTLHADDLDAVFDGKDSVEVRCDYCNTIYDIKRA